MEYGMQVLWVTHYVTVFVSDVKAVEKARYNTTRPKPAPIVTVACLLLG